ncbi:MAG: hypothetical protein ACXVB9_13465 [Bdellovibrionota bacterium]
MSDSKGESTFLHDFASPLTSLFLNLENMMVVLEDGKEEDEDLTKAMAKNCLCQIQKMTELIQHRRSILIQETEGE